METELTQAINSITESINALAQPRFIDWLAVILSGLAIWFAIRVPKKIADRQDKIALFEKRYECFQFFEKCVILCKNLTDADNEVSMQKTIQFCCRILEVQKVDDIDNNYFVYKMDQFEYTLHQMPFLFPGIKEDDVAVLYHSLVEFLQAIISQKNIKEKRRSYLEAMSKFEKYTDEIWESITISNIK